MKTTNEKLNTGELEVLEWLKGQSKTAEILKKIEKLEPIDWDSDPEFVANFAKSMVTEDILAIMREQKINQSHLAQKLGKSRQYISRILNETANFTIDSLAEIACALNRKIEVRMIGKTQHVFITDDYKSIKTSNYSSMNSVYNMNDAAGYPPETEYMAAEPQAKYNAKKERENEKKFDFAA